MSRIIASALLVRTGSIIKSNEESRVDEDAFL
jgi:hypothetical protein